MLEACELKPPMPNMPLTNGTTATTGSARRTRLHRAFRPVLSPWVYGLAACLARLVSLAASAHPTTLELPKNAAPLTIPLASFPADTTAPPGGVQVNVTGTVRANGTFEAQDIIHEGEYLLFAAAAKDVVA